MRRSEMIALLKEQVWYHFNCGCCQSDDVVYDKVLNALEVAGMLPPKRSREMNWNELGITYSDWLQLPYKINEWEPEDEKK